MAQNLWSLALFQALMKARLDFFYGRMEGDGVDGRDLVLLADTCKELQISKSISV